MAESSTNEVATQRFRLMEELRAYGANFTEFSRRFAAWLAMHSTDAAALLEISAAEERGDPLSPARLGERITLSSGATTAAVEPARGGRPHRAHPRARGSANRDAAHHRARRAISLTNSSARCPPAST